MLSCRGACLVDPTVLALDDSIADGFQRGKGTQLNDKTGLHKHALCSGADVAGSGCQTLQHDPAKGGLKAQSSFFFFFGASLK